MWGTTLTIIAFEVINVALIIGGFLAIAWVYTRRFNKLSQLVGEAFAERDMAFRKLQADLAHAYVTDTSMFDTALEDLSDPEVPIDRKKETDGNEEPDSQDA